MLKPKRKITKQEKYNNKIWKKEKPLKDRKLLFFLPEACNFIKKETLAQVFSCEFWKISKNTFFVEHFRWLFLLF